MKSKKWIIYVIAVIVGVIIGAIAFKSYFEKHARDGETIIAPAE